MGCAVCVRTTIDIADSILLRAKEMARRQKTTLRALAEEGLEVVLRQREVHGSVRVEPAVFNGQGIAPEFQGASWERLCAAAYEGRG